MLRTQAAAYVRMEATTTVEDRPQIEVAISLDDDQISAIFREFDTSKDGFIDLGELQAALGRAEGKPVSIEQAADILKLVDENDDGRISLEEFKQIFRLDAPDSLQTLARAFLDEIRDEVQRTGQFNGPILATAFTAGFLGLFWKYIVAITALYSQNDASWLPESLSLLQTVPSNFLADYQQAVILAPLLTMACTSGFAYAVGDLVAQVVEGRWRAELLDLERCARTSLLGFALHGPLVYGWIQVLEGPLATLAGGGADGAASSQWSTLLLKIFLDQTFFSALINILFASLNGILSKMTPREAFTRAREVLVPAMVSSWRFWPVVQLISYSPLIPVDFKLLWIDTMEILWVAYLSATVNGEAEGSDSAPEVTLKVPWGEGRFVAQSSTIVLDEPGDSDLLVVGDIALVASLFGLAALTWPGLVIEAMSS